MGQQIGLCIWIKVHTIHTFIHSFFSKPLIGMIHIPIIPGLLEISVTKSGVVPDALSLQTTMEDMHVCMLSCFSHVWLFATLRTIAHQAPLSMGFTSQEYWSGLPFPSRGDLPDSGIEPSLLLCRESLYHWTTREAWKAGKADLWKADLWKTFFFLL